MRQAGESEGGIGSSLFKYSIGVPREQTHGTLGSIDPLRDGYRCQEKPQGIAIDQAGKMSTCSIE